MGYQYNEYWTVEEIFSKAEELEGKMMSDIDKSGWLINGGNKGRIGNMIQEDFFGIKANSLRESDFVHHDIELKVTPVLKNGKGYSSKERLVLGMINYQNDYKIAFNESLPMKKTKKMLLIFYLHEENIPPREFKIVKTVNFEIDPDDLGQVEKDYDSIVNMILGGRAHEISEKQQKLLGACTKGQGKGRDLVKQPFSAELAKSRAYSYKTGYMTSYFKQLMRPEDVEHVLYPPDESFIEMLSSTLDKYLGKTALEIQSLTNCKTKQTSKSLQFDLMTSMFEEDGQSIKNINRTEEFLKEGYAIKTVKNRYHKKDNQDMSFPNLDFTELSYDSFEDSTWYGYFAETTYILALWDEYEPEKYRFVDYLTWPPSKKIVETAEQLYNHVQKMVQNREVIIKKNPNSKGTVIWSDNLPGKHEYSPFQIRTKGSGKSVYAQIPVNKQTIKKKALYINKEYIRRKFGLD